MKNTQWKPRLTASLFIILLMCTFNCFAQGITKADGTYTEPGRYIKDIRYGNQRSDISPKDRSSDRLLDIYLKSETTSKWIPRFYLHPWRRFFRWR